MHCYCYYVAFSHDLSYQTIHRHRCTRQKRENKTYFMLWVQYLKQESGAFHCCSCAIRLISTLVNKVLQMIPLTVMKPPPSWTISGCSVSFVSFEHSSPCKYVSTDTCTLQTTPVSMTDIPKHLDLIVQMLFSFSWATTVHSTIALLTNNRSSSMCGCVPALASACARIIDR